MLLAVGLVLQALRLVIPMPLCGLFLSSVHW